MTTPESILARHFPPRPHMAPRGRFRGQTRYYHQLAREHESISIDPAGWFDLWHIHADFSGYGNLSARHRRLHLDAHVAAFHHLAGRLANRTEPFQLWLYLRKSDAGCDAVYLHTPNPNGTPFPCRPLATWSHAPLADVLNEAFGMPPVRVGLDDDGNAFAYAPGIGVPPE